MNAPPSTPGVFDSMLGQPFAKPDPRGRQRQQTEYPNLATPAQASQEYPGQDQTPNSGGQPKRAGVAPNGSGYDLNFQNADLGQVVQVILRDTLHESYVMDPNLRGTVTMSAVRALTRDDLLAALETVLQINGAALAKTANGYKIVATGVLAAGGGATQIDYANERRTAGAGYGITIIPLKYLSSTEMMRMLSGFVAAPGDLRAEVNRNVLFIRGTGIERANLSDVALSFDVDWMKGQSAGIYRLAYATPDEMIAELENVFRNRQGQPGQNLVRFQPIKRLNAVLALTTRADLLKEIKDWVQRLDKTDPLAESLFVYRVEHGKAKDLADLLNRSYASKPTLETAASDVAPDRRTTITTTEAKAPVLENRPGTGQGLGTDTGAPADAGNANAASANRLPVAEPPASNANVHIVADVKDNKLLIRASLRDYKKIVQILGRLDRPAAQVMINATLAEVRLNKNLQYGVQAYLQQTNPGHQGVLGFTNNDQSISITPGVPGLNFLVGLADSPKVILSALANQTSVHVVSSPSVVVVNNEAAILQVGDDVPVTTQQVQSVQTTNAPIVNAINYVKTGVILKVTPRINTEGLVTMDIEQEISAVSNGSSKNGTGSLTPTISKRRVSSTISVHSGQMVVLGGLVTEEVDKFRNSVPLLDQIPLFGEAVGKTDDAGSRTELVIFIQPKVIHDGADAALIADELRQRIGNLAPDDRRSRRMLEFGDRRDAPAPVMRPSGIKDQATGTRP